MQILLCGLLPQQQQVQGDHFRKLPVELQGACCGIVPVLLLGQLRFGREVRGGRSPVQDLRSEKREVHQLLRRVLFDEEGRQVRTSAVIVCCIYFLNYSSSKLKGVLDR